MAVDAPPKLFWRLLRRWGLYLSRRLASRTDDREPDRDVDSLAKRVRGEAARIDDRRQAPGLRSVQENYERVFPRPSQENLNLILGKTSL